jgi:hypothetical protein
MARDGFAITLIYAERGSAARIAYIGTQYDTGSKGLPMMNTDRYVQWKADPPKYIFPAHMFNAGQFSEVHITRTYVEFLQSRLIGSTKVLNLRIAK